MNERELRRRFPNAAESFIKKNSDNYSREPSTVQSQPMDGKPLEEGQGSEAMGKTYRVVDCSIEFHASHGKKLDRDNKDNVRKCIWDAVVNLGFESNDQDFNGEVEQRLDKDNSDI